MSDETTISTTPTWRLVGWSCHQTASAVFNIAMMFASYLATGSYGVSVVLAGLIATYARLFDAIIDPFLAIFTDRIRTKFGRIRILIILGRTIQILSMLALFFWGIGKGAIVFTVIYCFYFIGASIGAIASHTGNPIITTNPKQRPIIFRWMMIFTTIIGSFTSLYMSNYLFRKHQGLNLGAFQELAVTVILIGIVMEIIASISISPYDRPGAFPQKRDGTNINFKDIWNLLKGNRAMQMYLISGVSDKIASQASSQAAITTLVFGIIIGNYEFSGIFSMIKLVPTILLLLYGTHLAGKYGTKKALVQWSSLSIACAVAMIVFLAVSDPTRISVSIAPTAIFIIIYLAYLACMNVTAACTNAMVPDIVDYELYRSGSFMPGVVGTLYSFIDEMVSSISTTIVGFCLAAIGYVSAQPQPGDPSTTSIFWMTMFLWLGMPILGWICTLIAMKWYPLDREKMVEVQTANRKIREEAQAVK